MLLNKFIKLPIPRDETDEPYAFQKIDNILWSVKVKKTDGLQRKIEIECWPQQKCDYWEYDIAVFFGNFPNYWNGHEEFYSEIRNAPVRNTRFTNHKKSHDFLINNNVDGVKMKVTVFQTYDFKPEMLFADPVMNISDFKLKVEGQTLHVCKKILAQQSLVFYDLFYGEDADQNLQEYEIKEATCNSFRIFLMLMYNRGNSIKMKNWLSIAELSARFMADQCLETCAKFLIRASITAEAKLKYAQGFDFKVLDRTEYLRELPSFEKLATETIEGLKWTYSSRKDENDFIHITVQCDGFDVADARICKVSINKSEEIRFGTHEFSIKNRKHVFISEKPYPSHYNIYIVIQTITELFPERSTSFSEIRPNLTDVVLSVGDKKFHVSKQILASSSCYFYTMFYGGFYENGKTEIELKGIEADEFEKFLQFVYHPTREIADNDIENLLKFCDMYDSPVFINRIEKILYSRKNFNTVQKALLAEKYKCSWLMMAVVTSIHNYEYYETFTNQEGFEQLQEDTVERVKKHVEEHERLRMGH